MPAPIRSETESPPTPPPDGLAAIIVAGADASFADIASSIATCRSETAEVIVVGVDGASLPCDDHSVTVVRHGATLGDSMREGARRVVAPRCVIVDPLARSTPGSLARHAACSVDVISVVGLPLPTGNRAGANAARAALARRSGIALPTKHLASDDFELPLDDVVCSYRSLERLRTAGIEIVELEPSASRTSEDRAEDERVMTCAGTEAIHLFRSAPDTVDATGLGSYRDVSYSTFLRRRFSLSPGSRLSRRRSSTPSDTAFWAAVRGECTRPEWAGFTAATTILMYHAFADEGPASRYVVTRGHLRRQLRLLKMTRRRVMSLDEYVATRRDHQLVAPRTVVITIDDGYVDTYTVAAPELRRADMTATLFVPTGHVGSQCDWTTEPSLVGRPIATWSQMRSGLDTIAIGSHARHHVALDELDDDQIELELSGSADDVSAGLGRQALTFAYPFGAESARTLPHLERSSYLAGCTSRGGRNAISQPMQTLRRVEIRGDASLWAFWVALATGSSLPLRTQIRGAR